MSDKQERNILFPGQRVNFSSLGTGTPHFQNADIPTPSYFMDMDIVEEISKKKRIMNQSKDNSGFSPVLSENYHYYDKDNFSVGQQAAFDNFNNVLLSNLRPSNFQLKEPFFHETYKEEIVNLGDVEHSGYQPEYGCDIVNTFLLGRVKQQNDILIPHSPVDLESSTSEQACLEREELKNKAFVSRVLESIYLGKQDTLKNGQKDQSLLQRSLYVNASLNSEKSTGSGDGSSANIDEQNKPSNWRLSPVISEKIWDGSLKLNTSTTVSAIAFFKSGEKVQDLNWPDNLEIKGKVRLHAFEKFIQELPRSRNRALMVISLCWKLGSCQSGLSGMMEVAKGYRETERVGFAQIPHGIDLYVCPRSDVIITILAKYGFFKGMAAVEEDRDSLIGCVVWRRSQSSTHSNSQTAAEGKKTLIQEQPLKSTGLSIQEMNSPSLEINTSEKKFMPSDSELKSALELPGSEAAKAAAVPETKVMVTESKAATVQTITPIPYSCPLVPSQQSTCERPSLKLLQEKMKPAGFIHLAENSGTDKADLVSDSWTQIVSPPQMAPAIALQSSLSSNNLQSIGMFSSVPAPGPRPLIPVISSNFQFRPQVVQITHSSLLEDSNGGRDSSSSVKHPAPSFQEARPAPPGPLLLPIEMLQSFIQQKRKVPEAIIDGMMLQDKTQSMHHAVTRRHRDVLDSRAPSANYGGSNDDNDDHDDLPEFDFDSACEEQSNAPASRLPECSQQAHFPGTAPLFNEKPSFEAVKGKYFEAFQHRHKSSSIPGKAVNSNEGLFLVKKVGENIAKKPPTEGYQLPHHSSSLKEGNDLGNDPRHGFGSEHKNLWDDDDDMPEWCPPDLELPEPTATVNTMLLSGRTLPPPPSFRPSQTRELQQLSQPGLLGPRPSSAALAGGFTRSKPPLESRRTDSVRPHAGRFKLKRRPHYDVEHRRHRH